MKTVIAIEDGKIAYDSTANATMVKFKKGDDVTLPNEQADFLVKCGKAEDKVKAEVKTEANTNHKKNKNRNNNNNEKA